MTWETLVAGGTREMGGGLAVELGKEIGMRILPFLLRVRSRGVSCPLLKVVLLTTSPQPASSNAAHTPQGGIPRWSSTPHGHLSDGDTEGEGLR